MKKILLIIIFVFCSPAYSWTSFFKSCDEKWEAAWEKCATCDTLPEGLRPSCELEIGDLYLEEIGGKESEKAKIRSGRVARMLSRMGEEDAERPLIRLEEMSMKNQGDSLQSGYAQSVSQWYLRQNT